MKRKSKIFTAAAVAIFSTVSAQQKLTLNEAVSLGLKNSPNLKIDAAKVEEALGNYQLAKNAALPSLKASASALALANASVAVKVLPPSQNGGGMPTANSAFFGNVSASLPVYAGGKIKYGIQSANYLVEAAKLSAENDRDLIALSVSQAYNSLFKAQKTIEILEQNLASARQRDETFQKLENNGLIARNDKLKVNLQTSNIELQLLDAHNNFDVATLTLDVLLGLPESTAVTIDEEYISEPILNPVTFYLEQAFAHRKDAETLKMQKLATELAVKSASAENLPTIALTGGYIAADVPNILTVYNAANVGVSVQYTIDNLWKKNSALTKAQAQETQLMENQRLLNDQIRLNINRDYKNANLARQRIIVFDKTVSQSEENYRVTKNKFDNGLANTTDLLDADTARVNAVLNLSAARADAALAVKKLEQTAGILLLNK